MLSGEQYLQSRPIILYNRWAHNKNEKTSEGDSIPMRMCKLKRQSIAGCGEDVKGLGLYTLLLVMQNGGTTLESSCPFLKSSTYISTRSGHYIPRYVSQRNEGTCPCKGFYTSVYNSFICNSLELETFQMALISDRRKDLQSSRAMRGSWAIKPYSWHMQRPGRSSK